MDFHQPDRVLAFDSLFTNNQIQMLKLLLGYMDPAVQGKLAVYIKFQELQYTLKLISDFPSLSMTPCFHTDSGNKWGQLLDEILPFCNREDQEILQNLKNMYQNFENMQEMMEMIDLLKEMSPELFSGENNGNGMDFSQILNMSQGADLSQMMDMMNMMQGMFSQSNSDT